MIYLIAILVFLAIIGSFTYYLRERDSQIILSHIGGFVVGVNYITSQIEKTEEDEYSEQRILAISLAFISITYIWFAK